MKDKTKYLSQKPGGYHNPVNNSYVCRTILKVYLFLHSWNLMSLCLFFSSDRTFFFQTSRKKEFSRLINKNLHVFPELHWILSKRFFNTRENVGKYLKIFELNHSALVTSKPHKILLFRSETFSGIYLHFSLYWKTFCLTLESNGSSNTGTKSLIFCRECDNSLALGALVLTRAKISNIIHPYKIHVFVCTSYLPPRINAPRARELSH